MQRKIIYNKRQEICIFRHSVAKGFVDMLEFEKDILSMTQMEAELKKCLLLRPDVIKKILTAEELTEYQAWITSINLQKNIGHFSPQEISGFPNVAKAYDHLHITDSFTFQHHTYPLFHHTDIITESQEILTDHDISVGRMLRYFPAHWHANEFFEIYYSLSGECPVYFEDEVVTVKPGTVLVVAPSVVHATPCYGDDRVLLYYLIRSSTFDHVFWSQLPSDNLMSTFFRHALNSHHSTAYLHFETDGDKEILQLLYRIYQEYCRTERYGAQMLNALMSELFILLLRRYEGTARLPRTKDFYWKHQFSGILTYIQTHFTTATQAQIGQHFHYSERQIGRIVQSCTGLTYAELIMKLRMEQAVKLLQQKTLSADAIAAAVGYSTSCSFYRAFSKYYGCTPGAYSKHLSNQDHDPAQN